MLLSFFNTGEICCPHHCKVIRQTPHKEPDRVVPGSPDSQGCRQRILSNFEIMYWAVFLAIGKILFWLGKWTDLIKKSQRDYEHCALITLLRHHFSDDDNHNCASKMYSLTSGFIYCLDPLWIRLMWEEEKMKHYIQYEWCIQETGWLTSCWFTLLLWASASSSFVGGYLRKITVLSDEKGILLWHLRM